MSENGHGFSWSRLRATFFGKPIPNARAHNERLAPFLGLPVFASDALSSVAYATEAILGILILAGTSSLGMQLGITAGIALLIVIISFSYNQTIHAYPNGGGSYIVASDNLGHKAGVAAGAALLIDYILTVSVSVAAGVAAIVSAFPHLHRYLIPLSVFSILFIAWLNLRGLKESGRAFALPVYGFIVGIMVMIAVGLWKHGITPVVPTVRAEGIGKEAQVAAIFLILRAFAAGCTALTGVEAVSNGVPAFKAPESHNAATTLRWMTALLVTMFLGIGVLARTLPHLNLMGTDDPGYRSVVSQIAAAAFGGEKSFGFYYVQFATALILVLAANTSFADFPRLASLMARDGFLPRSLARQGDRLVFHNGIVLLAIFASALIVYFRGQLDLLLPLYAVGVFSAFTLSQTGMVVHWRRVKGARWKRSAVINGLGATLSGIVLLVIFLTKFKEGAWIVGVLMVGMYLLFNAIRGRYKQVSDQLTIDGPMPPPEEEKHLVLLLVPRVHKGILNALEYALLIKGSCRAVHVTLDERSLMTLQRNWERYGAGVPLIILNSPYRSLIDPLLDYLDEIHTEDPDTIVTVIVPEAISKRFFQKLLQENVALHLKVALSSRKNVVVTNVRYFLS